MDSDNKAKLNQDLVTIWANSNESQDAKLERTYQVMERALKEEPTYLARLLFDWLRDANLGCFQAQSKDKRFSIVVERKAERKRAVEG